MIDDIRKVDKGWRNRMWLFLVMIQQQMKSCFGYDTTADEKLFWL